MDISAVQTLGVAQATSVSPAKPEAPAPSLNVNLGGQGSSSRSASQEGRSEAPDDSAPRASSMEEQAIRAAFQAQLSSGELLSVVRDPADLVLPDKPDGVV